MFNYAIQDPLPKYHYKHFLFLVGLLASLHIALLLNNYFFSNRPDSDHNQGILVILRNELVKESGGASTCQWTDLQIESKCYSLIRACCLVVAWMECDAQYQGFNVMFYLLSHCFEEWSFKGGGCRLITLNTLLLSRLIMKAVLQLVFTAFASCIYCNH